MNIHDIGVSSLLQGGEEVVSTKEQVEGEIKAGKKSTRSARGCAAKRETIHFRPAADILHPNNHLYPPPFHSNLTMGKKSTPQTSPQQILVNFWRKSFKFLLNLIHTTSPRFEVSINLIFNLIHQLIS